MTSRYDLRKHLLIRASIYLFLIGLNLFVAAREIAVAAAANLRYVMEELEPAFEQASGTELKLIFASSGKLTTQIRNGAPFDIFLSADSLYPAMLIEEGFAEPPLRIYALGVLVVWSADTSFAIADWQHAQHPQLALANPQVAPYGQATVETLKNLGLFGKWQSKLVYGNNIAQVSQYILSGAADFGFSAKSVVLSPRLAARGVWQEIPAGLHRPIRQGAVVLRQEDKLRREAAQQLLNFLTSPAGQAIFIRYGYRLESP